MCFILESYRLFAHLYSNSVFDLDPVVVAFQTYKNRERLQYADITTHNSYRQVKSFFHSLTPGEIALRAQRKTLEKIERNIAGKPAQLKTSEARMVKWIKEYNRSS